MGYPQIIRPFTYPAAKTSPACAIRLPHTEQTRCEPPDPYGINTDFGLDGAGTQSTLIPTKHGPVATPKASPTRHVHGHGTGFFPHGAPLRRRSQPWRSRPTNPRTSPPRPPPASPAPRHPSRPPASHSRPRASKPRPSAAANAHDLTARPEPYPGRVFYIAIF